MATAHVPSPEGSPGRARRGREGGARVRTDPAHEKVTAAGALPQAVTYASPAGTALGRMALKSSWPVGLLGQYPR